MNKIMMAVAVAVAMEGAAFADRTANQGWVRDNFVAKEPSRNYAMFIIPVNLNTNQYFVGFELKATTNNFTTTQFYSQSCLADTPLASSNDAMRMFVESYYAETDGRKYHAISNTVTWTHPLVNVAVIVDASCLYRFPAGGWLTEENDDLVWSYVRTRQDGHEEEMIVDGECKHLWRPVMPVRWFRNLPDWAK